MKKNSQQSGFSLVETLVSITILLIVIVGPMKISSQAAKSSSFSSEQVTAFFLAQEGIELAEKARDDLLLQNSAGSNPDPWADFTRTTIAGTYRLCYAATGCGIAINQDAMGTLIAPKDCSTVTNCLLYLDGTNPAPRSSFTYTVGANTVTPFTRIVYMEIVNANEVKVTSKVTWRTGSLKSGQTVVVETRLFNVYGNS